MYKYVFTDVIPWCKTGLKGPRLSIALTILNGLIALYLAASLWSLKYVPDTTLRTVIADTAVVGALYYGLLGILLLIMAAVMVTDEASIVHKAGVIVIVLSALSLNIIMVFIGIVAGLIAHGWKPKPKRKTDTILEEPI